MSDITTWRKELDEAMQGAGDPGPVLAVAPSEAVLDVPFDSGFGGSQGQPMLAWTETRVYFPVVYDGSEWIESAPRNPTGEGQGHVGGE